MSKQRQAVRRGVKLLDAAVPGWRNQIVPQSLDVSSIFNCPLAQVSGTTFSAGADLLGVNRRTETAGLMWEFRGQEFDAAHYGFAGSEPSSGLSAAWLDELYGVPA